MVERAAWTRRGFVVGGVGVAAAAAGGAAWLLARDGEPGAAPGSTAPPSATIAPPPTPSPTPVPRGGLARIAAAARLDFDTFDPLRTVERSVEEVLGRTHSRLLQWADYGAGTLAGDLASGWEQADAFTVTVTLATDATWHDRRPLDGRRVTAADLVAHFERLLTLRTAGQLSAPLVREFASLQRLSAPDDSTLVFEISAPDPFLVTALASRFAVVTAPEAVERFAGSWHELAPESVVGSGPFAYEGDIDGALQFSRHPAAHRPANLDGLRVFGPHGSGEGPRDRFLSRQLDAFLARDRRDTAALRGAAPGARESARIEDTPTLSSVFAGAPPWSDPRLLIALNGALNRIALIERLHAGQAAPAGPVSPASPAFALSEFEMSVYPGYGDDAVAEATAARTLWDLGGGPALGTVTIDVPTIYDPLYSASSVVTGMLNEVLGPQFVASAQPYTTISARAVAREYGNGAARLWFGWGPRGDSPDPSRGLIDTYRSGSPGWEAFGVTLPALDATLDRLGSEFDLEVRQELTREACRTILEAGGAGVFTWLQQTGALFEWPAFHSAPATPFWSGHLDADAYLEPDAARPS